MNFATHIEIGNALYEELCKVVDLDRESFIYGNIKPDCTPKAIIIPHTLTNYLDPVLNLANRLMEEDLTKGAFSEGLGTLCHFMSDFSCLYHANEDKFHKFVGHILYEKRLHSFHRKKESSFFKSILSIRPNLVRDLRESIINFREEYFSQPHSIELDFFYAYRLCKLACQSVAYYRTGRVLSNQVAYHEQVVYVKEGLLR